MQSTNLAWPVIEWLGDSAVTVCCGDPASPDVRHRVRRFAARLLERPPACVYDVAAGHAVVGVFFDPLVLRRVAGKEGMPVRPLDWLAKELTTIWSEAEADREARAVPARVVELPVCYGGEFGPDLTELAEAKGLTAAEAVALHAGIEYEVQMIGFVPGFPYLSGLPTPLHGLRKPTPRLSVPAGSVGIGGTQTGVYPLEIPGGWQLIGRTPLRLFDPAWEAPSLLAAGDRVRFVPIDEQAFRQLHREAGTG